MPGVRSLDVTVDGKLVLARDQSDKHCLILIDLPSTKPRSTEKLCAAAPFSAVAFSPSRKLLAAATRTGTVKIWDAESLAEVAQYTGLPNGISQIRFNPGEASFTILAEGGEAEVWPVSVKTDELPPWHFYRTQYTADKLDEDIKALESKSRDLTEQERQAALAPGKKD